jgi:hypothetical protein
MTTDPMSRIRMVGLVFRVTERAVRTWPLGEWALLRRVLPDGGSSAPDPRRFMPDKGSSLALDDLDFMPKLGAHVVSSTARFPVMNAAENLVGAGQVQSATFQENRTSVAGAGTLCRAAIESSAKTIWLLAEPSREVRRARCLGYIERERSYQQKFVDLEELIYEKREDAERDADYESFQRHRDEYDERQAAIAALPEEARQKPARSFEKIVEWSAKWIDENPPPHAADELALGMTLGATSFYSSGSSFVHGYKWMSDYIRNDEDTLKIIADGLAAALIMTECAVALFEAQATHAARASIRKNYPDRLTPTVAEWMPRYLCA